MSVQPSNSSGSKVAPPSTKEQEAMGGVPSDGAPEGEARAAWGGQIEFILTLVGFAVGLGNVWRFPYLCYENGGGAFLIPYLISLILLGMPLFYMECAIGQFVSKGSISFWKNIAPAMKGLGFGTNLVSVMIVVYYQVIVAWAFYFFFASMNTDVPWRDCNNDWNTQYCVANYTKNMTLPFNKTLMKTPSEEYFYNNVLGISDGLENYGSPRWQLAVLLLFSWCIVFVVICKGIASLGKASYFISIFPYILLTVMLIRGATLPGAGNGILYYLKPDFAKLGQYKVWSAAANQIFYSLGVSLGGLLAMSSFNQFKNNIRRDAILVPIINCSTSIYAGFVIFSVLGYMADSKGLDIKDVARSGPGLVFIVYPEGLATMPVSPLMSVLFFFMMTLLGFSSQFSTIESVITAFVDEYPKVLGGGNRPVMVRAAFCSVGFLLGLPFVCNGGYYMFKIFDDYAGGYPLLFIGFMEIIVVQFIYGYKRFREDVELMLGSKPNLVFMFILSIVTPALIAAVLILKVLDEKRLALDDYPYPDWGWALCYVISVIPVLLIVGYAIAMCIFRAQQAQDGLCSAEARENVAGGFKPVPEWGPALPENRTGRYAPPISTIEDTAYKMAANDDLQMKAVPGAGHENQGFVGETPGIGVAPPAYGSTTGQQEVQVSRF